MSQDIESLKNALQASKVARARALTPGQRFAAGFQLFEMVRNRMLAGIRAENPSLVEKEVEQEFQKRLSDIRKREELSIYKVIENTESE